MTLRATRGKADSGHDWELGHPHSVRQVIKDGATGTDIEGIRYTQWSAAKRTQRSEERDWNGGMDDEQ